MGYIMKDRIPFSPLNKNVKIGVVILVFLRFLTVVKYTQPNSPSWPFFSKFIYGFQGSFMS